MTFDEWYDPMERQSKFNSYYESCRGLAEASWNAALESQWQPIESAPKDGTIILATDGSNWVRVVLWAKDLEIKCGDDHDLDLHPWICLDEEHGLNAWEDGALTHWMPLPKPPSSKE